MVHFILKIFDYFKSHKYLGILSLLFISIFLVLQVSRLDYKEDISDFLPLEGKELNALKIYQDISGANRIIVSFSFKDSTKTDPDIIIESISNFVEDLSIRDEKGMVKDLVHQIDMDKFALISDFVYQNIPYFLDETDYAKMDSAISQPGYVRNQLLRNKQMLMSPMGGLMSEKISIDPLNLFTTVVSRLQNTSNSINYELYEGYIFTPDMKRGLVMLSSPFGSSETEKNSELISLLQSSIHKIDNPDLDIRVIGAPIIAVGNAKQIKTDSMFSVSLAVVLILLFLWICFRNSRNLLLIVLSIGWGWLFAMGGLALVHNEVSVIVIGISSVILGIAVNYPLHLIAHLSHTPDMRTALKEIVAPLIVGNITTVGAFLSLVPLESSALRDLGLFSSFLLIGTIIFVMIYLPHVVKSKHQSANPYISRIGNLKLENNKWVVWVILILTCVFGFFSNYTSFDSNMSNINYMTDAQKQDMLDLAQMISGRKDVENLYIVSTDTSMDGALDKSKYLQPVLDKLLTSDDIKCSSCSKFLVSNDQQKKRIQQWNDFVSRYLPKIKKELKIHMEDLGFQEHSFDVFFNLMTQTYSPQKFEYFKPLSSSLFTSNFSIDSLASQYNIVDIVTVKKQNLPEIKSILESQINDSYCFDVSSMNSSIADTLSADFDYIGFACGTIVFFFLWFSLGSLELAILSFIPMFVSWIWILGIMGIMGIHFNIVNIILATFIFGQGDDYTIFMTEGCCFEYAYRKKMLPSYKNSITISALIMFIGIGSLIFAKHPALFSLAQVTIIGMFSVVLMAYLFPPLIYNWLIKKRGEYRERPITIISIIRFTYCAVVFYSQIITVYILGFILLDLLKATERRKLVFRKYVSFLYKLDMNNLPGVKFFVSNVSNETFEKSTLIISNHQSLLDSCCFFALTHKIIFITNKYAAKHKTIGRIFRWLELIIIEDYKNLDGNLLRDLIKRGYHICIFPEGKRNNSSSINRFHKGAFDLALKLGTDITPVFIHGLNHVLPNKKEMRLFPGEIHIEIGKRIEYSSFQQYDRDKIWRNCYHLYQDRYRMIKRRYEKAAYFKEYVKDRYRFKGAEIFRDVSNRLKSGRYDNVIDSIKDIDNVIINNDGCGEMALLMALVHPEIKIFNVEKNEDSARILMYSSESVVDNLEVYLEELPENICQLQNDRRTLVFDVTSTEIKKLNKL